MLKEILEDMMNDVIRKYGFEDPKTVDFAEKCKEVEETFTYIVCLYEKLMEV